MASLDRTIRAQSCGAMRGRVFIRVASAARITFVFLRDAVTLAPLVKEIASMRRVITNAGREIERKLSMILRNVPPRPWMT